MGILCESADAKKRKTLCIWAYEDANKEESLFSITELNSLAHEKRDESFLLLLSPSLELVSGGWRNYVY